MPTVTEIKFPYISYCEKWDIHCPCVKCKNPVQICRKKLSGLETHCEMCLGPNKNPDPEDPDYNDVNENDIFECSLQHMSAIKFIKNIDDLNKKFGRKRKTGTNQCQQ